MFYKKGHDNYHRQRRQSYPWLLGFGSWVFAVLGLGGILGKFWTCFFVFHWKSQKIGKSKNFCLRWCGANTWFLSFENGGVKCSRDYLILPKTRNPFSQKFFFAKKIKKIPYGKGTLTQLFLSLNYEHWFFARKILQRIKWKEYVTCFWRKWSKKSTRY